MSAIKKGENVRRLRANEEKWGLPLVEAGWTLIPSVILEYQQQLGLDAVEVNILLQITRHWWKPGDAPFPSIRTIAECMGMTPNAVQKRITKLKAKGIIEIEHRKDKFGGQTSSKYFFKGLIEKALPFAEKNLARIEEKKKEKAERTRDRRRPRKLSSGQTQLKVVKE